MIYKAVLFDMDGVLIDSGYAMREASINMLKEDYGISPVHEDFKPFTGMGEKAYIGGVAEKYGVPYNEEMKIKAYTSYGSDYRHLIKTFDGVREMVLSLKAKGYKLAVASSADRMKVEINLSCIGLTPKDFDGVLTGSECEKKKPDPEIYLMAAAAIGVEPKDCVVIEDALSGVESGLRAGMECIGVATSFPEEKLKEAGCRYVVSEVKFIDDILN